MRVLRWEEEEGVAIELGQGQEEGEVFLAEREGASNCANRIVS